MHLLNSADGNTPGRVITDKTSEAVAVFSHCVTPKFIQQVEPSWSSTPAYGKMDAIPFFANTKRTMSISFSALGNKPGTSVDRLARSVRRLMQFQYPVYEESDGIKTIMSPPFFRLEHLENHGGSVFAPIEGYITQLRITPGSSVGTATTDSRVGHLFEKKYDVSFVLEVLQKKMPGWSRSGDWGGDRFFNFEGKAKSRRGPDGREQETRRTSKPLKNLPGEQNVDEAKKSIKQNQGNQ